MIVLRTPKGWTGPTEVDGLQVEGTWRAHQVPLAERPRQPGAPGRAGATGCARYRPEELFDADGAPGRRSWPRCAPTGERRMSANPHANGGLLLRDLTLPDFRDYAVDGRRARRAGSARPTRVLGALAARRDPAPTRTTFRLFGPDETASNRLGAVFEATDRAWRGRDRRRSTTTWRRDGRVMEVLSEHLCQGWLEGYLLTGRHGLFNCYEAFIHIVDSMFNQHAKWLKVDPAASPGGGRSPR